MRKELVCWTCRVAPKGVVCAGHMVMMLTAMTTLCRHVLTLSHRRGRSKGDIPAQSDSTHKGRPYECMHSHKAPLEDV